MVCAPKTELLLMFASRAQLVREVVRPALAAGTLGACPTVSPTPVSPIRAAVAASRSERIADLERWAAAGLKPDLTLLLDLPVADGLQRANGRGSADRIEMENADFFERVRAAYRARAAAEPARFRVIDASRPLDAGARRRSRGALALSSTRVESVHERSRRGMPRVATTAGAARAGAPCRMRCCSAARPGLGKREFADALAAHLLCERASGAESACGQCRALRLARRPAVIRMRCVVGLELRDDRTPRTEITVDQIRVLGERLALTPQFGGVQVALIDPADAMNASAANALAQDAGRADPGTLSCWSPTALRACRRRSAAAASASISACRRVNRRWRGWRSRASMRKPRSRRSRASRGNPGVALELAKADGLTMRAEVDAGPACPAWRQPLRHRRLPTAGANPIPSAPVVRRDASCEELAQARRAGPLALTAAAELHQASGMVRPRQPRARTIARTAADGAGDAGSAVGRWPRNRGASANGRRRNGRMPRQGILSLAIKDKAALYNAYMPFVRGGGLFVPTAKRYGLGDEVFILLTLMDDKDRLPVPGKVMWITPAGAQGNRTAGIGVQFNDSSDGETARTKIESILAGILRFRTANAHDVIAPDRRLSLPSQMRKNYFGTDGIRGRAGEPPITAEFMLAPGPRGRPRLGQRQSGATVLIGKDTRVSGYMLESALEAGLVSAGAECAPARADADTGGGVPDARARRGSAGIVISASHNPYWDNGIKFFSTPTAKKSPMRWNWRSSANWIPPCHRRPNASARPRASTMPRNAMPHFCRATVPGPAICAACTSCWIARMARPITSRRSFSPNSARRCTRSACKPDGLNINRDCGATHLAALQAAVRERGADIGIAFDGDGDRVQMVDADGVLVDGDDLLYILARDGIGRGALHGPVVGTLMTNFGVERAIAELGVEFLRANVGDRYVLQMLQGNTAACSAAKHPAICCAWTQHHRRRHRQRAARARCPACASGITLAQARATLRRVPQVMLNVRAAGGRRSDRAQCVRALRAGGANSARPRSRGAACLRHRAAGARDGRRRRRGRSAAGSHRVGTRRRIGLILAIVLDCEDHERPSLAALQKHLTQPTYGQSYSHPRHPPLRHATATPSSPNSARPTANGVSPASAVTASNSV